MALIVGTVFALAALSFVLYPLFVGDRTLNSASGIVDNDVVDPTSVCNVCGARPEPDAQFCSNCGRPVSR